MSDLPTAQVLWCCQSHASLKSMDSSLVQLRKLESRSKRYCTRVFCSLPHSFNRHLRLKQQTKRNKKNPDKKRDELLSISARSSVNQFRRPRATMQNTRSVIQISLIARLYYFHLYATIRALRQIYLRGIIYI